MKKHINADPLKRIYISTPCPVSWDSMSGDDRIRHCGQCNLNVYNVAELTESETLDLLRSSEERVCMRLYRRLDGTIITNNCPIGLRSIQRTYRKVAIALAAAIVCMGLMDSAQAQGLVGAPVDPRYGTSGMATFEQLSLAEKITQHPLGLAYVLTTIFFLLGLIAKSRATFYLVTWYLVLVSFSAGLLMQFVF